MKIMITGGAGTLGKAIMNRHPNHDYTVFSRDPLKHIAHEREDNDLSVRYVVGDIRDYNTLYNAMVGHDMVIHAAAQKHIPQAELNVLDTIETNVTGSANVAVAAFHAKVPSVIGISTDKACNPVNVYGVTKFLMERIFIEYHQLYNKLGTTYHLCRYGNVIGSNGSVIQAWQNAVMQGDTPKLTDPQMTRFWLRVSDAVDLVFESLKYPGKVTIPKAKSTNMRDFARIVLGDDVEVNITGRRPGEKLHEELYTPLESQFVEDVGDYYVLDVWGQPKAITSGYDSFMSADNGRGWLDKWI